MLKNNILQSIKQSKVVAVVSGKSFDEVCKIIDSLIAGGVVAIEVTFRMDEADKIIKAVSQKYADKKEVIIGAGTVLDEVTARIAILAGAKYIVSPGFDNAIAEICNLYEIPYLPGCLTITEIMKALKAGCQVVKLFPASAVGPEYIKAVKAPLPQVEIMPTGGVSLENVNLWFKAGVFAVGVGGNLVTLDENKDYSKITQTAKSWISTVNTKD
ncbi:MAG: bifunctional 2-keto-4-hydroxyglutarate aldolase/2-keto-3-deoxy-6-phosphogluconate aldolase [Bifidobacteriaceae bacterium]|jgi:2-dehydro-3-deoxyphosphogluconate aldolase/(4S)-4-hydroxy-2-oxoglutarate aldolase|nr:bifunctional 2-keto-4-hydroxyglutarate aldolase/2-keto-3-deoxy-6-phosphogluconate aldolase [Bifidobacteriaceae bacterium]